MLITISGTASSRLTQKRRVKSFSSGLGPSSVGAPTGSSAMPHLGQSPNVSEMTSGCIGQVYCAAFGADFCRFQIGRASCRERVQTSVVAGGCDEEHE